MVVPFTIRRLESKEDRPDFDCGSEDLNEFFQIDSKDFSNELMSVTYVAEAVADSATLSFFSVSNDAIKKEDLTISRYRRVSKTIPQTKRYSSYPAVKIGRLAASSHIQSQGHGTEILDYIKVWFTTGNKTGCRFIIVDAYNNPRTINFYKRNDFEFLINDNENDTTRLMYFDLIRFRK